MPNKDGTGPNGKGPKTGQGEGNCTERNIPGDGRGPCGKGQRRGLGLKFKIQK